MSISKYIVPISQIEELITELLTSDFSITETVAATLAKSSKKHFECLIDSCFLFAETPYVDKVYRDSYYSYYSSKSVPYQRDCIRISIFDGEVTDEDFRDPNKIAQIDKQYRGFVILRPTEPKIIGRSIISPLALKNKNFVCCTTKIGATVNSLKVCVNGFPHSSQDSETISCAETTLWALMEYFGTKYPEYKPVLPSTIIKTLKISFERQIPTKGLTVHQMSYALKEFGFGPRIYAKAAFNMDFERIFSTYIESGIPVVVALQGNIGGHAVLGIGRDIIADKHIDDLKPNIFENPQLLEKVNKRNLTIYDWDNITPQFIFIDDNFPAYQPAKFQEPMAHYPGENFKNFKITHFVAPLYPKIYLEAYEAKNYLYRYLLSELSPVDNNDEVFIRFYLASSRTYKHALSLNQGLNTDIKEVILGSEMPKFIWVAELSTKVKIKNKLAFGLIILDATEANLNYNYPLLLAYYKNKLITPNLKINTLEEKSVSLSDFSIFEGNLKTV